MELPFKKVKTAAGRTEQGWHKEAGCRGQSVNLTYHMFLMTLNTVQCWTSWPVDDYWPMEKFSGEHLDL